MEQFLTHLYQWTVQNPFMWGIICTVITFILGLILVPAKVIKAGFITSQYIRRIFGAKAEKAFEKAIDEFEQGLHSDNSKGDL